MSYYGMPGGYNYPYQPLNFQYQPTNYPQPQAQQVQPDGFQGITMVNSYDEALASIVPLNSRVLLMDNNSARFWVKTVNNSGVATMQEFEFQVVERPTNNPDDYVSAEQFNELQQQLNDLRSKYEQSDIREQSAEPITEW